METLSIGSLEAIFPGRRSREAAGAALSLHLAGYMLVLLAWLAFLPHLHSTYTVPRSSCPLLVVAYG